MEDSNTLEHDWEERYANCKYAERLLNKLAELNQQVTRQVDIDEIRRGIYYAKKYHGSQMRQSGEPYYSHPIEVAYMVAEYTALEMQKYFRTDMIITSLLHDTIEDTTLSEDMIARVFGKQIASQVADLTRVKSYGKISAAETLNILHSQNKKDILIIKLFDRLHNMQTIAAKSLEKIQKIKKETLISFLLFAQYLGMLKLEISLTTLCIKRESECVYKQHNLSIDRFQLPALTFQNDLSPTYILNKLVL